MSKVNGVVEAAMAPNKWGKNSILIGETWYSTDPAYMKTPMPTKGDVVEFDDGGKKYINNLRIVSKGEGAAKSSGSNYSHLGVELGHASNIAKDMAIAADIEVGSDEWYKFWMTHTQKVYSTMKALRNKFEAPPVVHNPDVVVLTGAAKPSSSPVEASEDISDIFQ